MCPCGESPFAEDCLPCGTGDDTGTGDGGGADGGGSSTGGGLPPDVNNPMPCDSVTQVAATHFSSGLYLDDEEVDPYECRCRYTSTSTEPEVEIQGIEVFGNYEGMRYPVAIAAEMPWHAGTETDTPTQDDGWTWYAWGGDDDDIFGGDDAVVIAAVDGAWDIFFSNKSWDGAYNRELTCAAVEASGMTITVQAQPRESTPAPPPMPVNPLDLSEDDLVCSGTTAKTTGIRLVDLPGWTHPVAIGISGERQYAFSKMDSLSVTAWNGADHLTIVGENAASVTLTPASSTANLASGSYWLGTSRWLPSRQDSSGSWTNPALSVTHSCPSSVGTTTRSVDQGYALTLGMLADAIDDATGSVGLGGILTGAPQTGWPVYVARVFPITGSPLSNGQDFVLTLEPQGSDALIWLPVTKTTFNHWSLEASGLGWAVEGTIARVPNKLVLTLTSGDAGPLELDQTVLDLPEHPDDGQ